MQAPKDIVVYLDSTDRDAYASRFGYAVALASRFDAHLTVAFVPEDLSLEPSVGFARGGAIANVLDAHRQREQRSEEALQLALERARASGVECELRVCKGEVGEPLMLHARHAGLAILGPGRLPERQVSALTLSEDVIFASGRPSLLLPVGWSAERAVGQIVIGWNGSRQAARAIADSMPFLISADAVHIVVVPEPKIANLLGEEPGADIGRHLARYGVNVTVHCMPGPDAGHILLTKAIEVDADLIVVGAYGQAKITEFIFGSATQTLLANPKVPTLLSC